MPPKLPNKVTFKTFSSAAGNARLSRKNLESLQSRAASLSGCGLTLAIRLLLARVRGSPFKFPPLLFPPAWSVADVVEREKGEGGTTRYILLSKENVNNWQDCWLRQLHIIGHTRSKCSPSGRVSSNVIAGYFCLPLRASYRNARLAAICPFPSSPPP